MKTTNKTAVAGRLFRQGDVIIQRIDEIPASARRVKLKRGQRIILAYGEATGHHHSLDMKDADWWKEEEQQPAPNRESRTGFPSDQQYLDVKQTTAVTHQEHAPITLEPGKYRVIQQREYSPAEIRRVQD